VLDYIYRNIAAQNSGPEAFIGVDMSEMGIQQANNRNPSLNWIIDSYQNLVGYAKAVAGVDGFDLIVNKGGFTFVEDASEYSDVMVQTRRLLGTDGRFLFVQSKNFYDHWTNQHCRHWPDDAIGLMRSEFGSMFAVPNASYHILVFAQEAVRQETYPPLKGQRDEPKRVVFYLGDGAYPYPVGHSEERLLRIAPYIEADWISHCRWKLESQEGNHVAHRRELLERYSHDRPDVVVPQCIWHAGPESNRGITEELLKRLAEANKVGYYPFRIRSSRTLTEHVYDMAAPGPRRVLLGIGMEDHLVDEQYGQPLVDMDEFESRVSWAVSVLIEDGIDVRYVLPNERLCGRKGRRGVTWDPATTAAFSAKVREIGAEQGITLISPEWVVAQGSWRVGKSEIAKVLAELV